MGRRLLGDRRGKRALVELFERFAVPIQWDFQAHLGIDVLDYFAGERSWHEFYEFLHELPRWGKYHSALQMDEEFAQHILELRREQKRRESEREWDDEDDQEFEVKTRSPEGYDPMIAALHGIDERIQALIRMEVQLHSKSKPPNVVPAPRPITMVDALERLEERDEMHEMAAAFGFGKKR